MRGHKAWFVAIYIRPTIVQLASFYTGFRWPESGGVEAKCDVLGVGGVREHLRSMDETHACGIYSFKTPEDIPLSRIANPPDIAAPELEISGVIYNYGVVVEHERGYRSSNAIIDYLYAPLWMCVGHMVESGVLVAATHIIRPATDYGYHYLMADPTSLCTEHVRQVELKWDGDLEIMGKQELLFLLSRRFNCPVLELPPRVLLLWLDYYHNVSTPRHRLSRTWRRAWSAFKSGPLLR